jgi:ferredoxin
MSGTKRLCGACGARAPSPFRVPQPEIAPDLDMRPGEPARSTLADWIQTCHACGAAAPDLQTLPASSRAVVDSSQYHSLTTSGLEETLPFRRWAMICHGLGDTVGEAEALLQATWAAEDAAAMTEASELRQRVVHLWGDPTDEAMALRQLDVLRRSGDFDAASARADALGRRELSDTARSIVLFQQKRITARDIGRHLISSVLPPPSHAPHASHVRRRPAGLWERLFRR